MTNRRMLLAFAHPDDESFGMGGTIARYTDIGTEVSLICTTNGDVGTIPEEMQDKYDTVASLRLSELECASRKLGLYKVFRFGYKDSGMMGAETNNDPDSSWHIWQTNPEAMVRRIVEVIREIKPQVVVTFNQYGGYGHPDHIAIQQATSQAFKLASDPTYGDSDLPPYQPQKLYYTSIPLFLVRIAIWRARLQGKNPRKLGRNKDIDLVTIIDHLEPIHAQIDIRRHLQAWDEANACHESQGGGRAGFLPRGLRKLLGAKQGFTRVYPEPLVNEVDEDDLFEGVSL